MKEIIIQSAENLKLKRNELHKGLFYKDTVSAETALKSGIGVSQVMYEKMDPLGQVLPHIHDVGEIIYLISGEVEVFNGKDWTYQKAGDTIVVPAGCIHSVKNIRDNICSEQVSYFIPMALENTNLKMTTTMM